MSITYDTKHMCELHQITFMETHFDDIYISQWNIIGFEFNEMQWKSKHDPRRASHVFVEFGCVLLMVYY